MQPVALPANAYKNGILRIFSGKLVQDEATQPVALPESAYKKSKQDDFSCKSRQRHMLKSVYTEELPRSTDRRSSIILASDLNAVLNTVLNAV